MARKFTNQEVAELLRNVAAAYTLLRKNRFEIIVYGKAADSVDQATDEVQQIWADEGEIELPGIGKSIGGYLGELFATGKSKHFDQVLSQFPPELFPLLRVPSVGPKTGLKLVELGVKSIDDLEEKIKNDSLVQKGFSSKIGENILQGINEIKKRTSRMLLYKAKEIADELIDYLKKVPEVQAAHALGSLRRKVATVGDIDLGVASNQPSKVIEHFLQFKSAKTIEAGDKSATIALANGLRVDILVGETENFGNLLQHFTGSQAHNVHIRSVAKDKGYVVSEYGIRQEFDRTNKAGESLLKFKTEKEVYGFFGMDYIEPELREDTGEIEVAQKGKLPKTINLEDLKGDLHTHTLYSDGNDTVEAMAKAGQSWGYEYMVITDHSYPNMDYEKRLKEIEAYNRYPDSPVGGEESRQALTLGPSRPLRMTVASQTSPSERGRRGGGEFHLLAGLEVNITVDGKLQVKDEILKLHAWNTASIHTGFNQSRDDITARMVFALEHPYIEALSHPTGRLINERIGYQANWEKVFEKAVKHQKFIEIDAYPNRLDLPDTLIREAIKYGVRFVLNSDAHATDQLDAIVYGIYTAKRGWATKDMVLNTLPWVEFKKHLKRL